MPDPAFFDQERLKLKALTGQGNVQILKNGTTAKKTANSSNWDTVVGFEIKKSYTSFKIKVNQTNSDNSGLSFGIGGKNELGGNKYSSGVCVAYNSGGGSSYPKLNQTYKFVVNTTSDQIEVWKNGTKYLGTKKPSSFQKPLYFLAHLYYLNNEITIVP